MSFCLPAFLRVCHRCNQGTGGRRRLMGWEGTGGEGIYSRWLGGSRRSSDPEAQRHRLLQQGSCRGYRSEQPFPSLSVSFPVWACLRSHYHIYRATWPHGTRMRGLERPIYFSSCAAILGGKAGGGGSREGRAPALGQKRITLQRPGPASGPLLASSNRSG